MSEKTRGRRITFAPEPARSQPGGNGAGVSTGGHARLGAYGEDSDEETSDDFGEFNLMAEDEDSRRFDDVNMQSAGQFSVMSETEQQLRKENRFKPSMMFQADDLAELQKSLAGLGGNMTFALDIGTLTDGLNGASDNADGFAVKTETGRGGGDGVQWSEVDKWEVESGTGGDSFDLDAINARVAGILKPGTRTQTPATGTKNRHTEISHYTIGNNGDVIFHTIASHDLKTGETVALSDVGAQANGRCNVTAAGGNWFSVAGVTAAALGDTAMFTGGLVSSIAAEVSSSKASNEGTVEMATGEHHFKEGDRIHVKRHFGLTDGVYKVRHALDNSVVIDLMSGCSAIPALADGQCEGCEIQLIEPSTPSWRMQQRGTMVNHKQHAEVWKRLRKTAKFLKETVGGDVLAEVSTTNAADLNSDALNGLAAGGHLEQIKQMVAVLGSTDWQWRDGDNTTSRRSDRVFDDDAEVGSLGAAGRSGAGTAAREAGATGEGMTGTGVGAQRSNGGAEAGESTGAGWSTELGRPGGLGGGPGGPGAGQGRSGGSGGTGLPGGLGGLGRQDRPGGQAGSGRPLGALEPLIQKLTPNRSGVGANSAVSFGGSDSMAGSKGTELELTRGAHGSSKARSLQFGEGGALDFKPDNHELSPSGYLLDRQRHRSGGGGLLAGITGTTTRSPTQGASGGRKKKLAAGYGALQTDVTLPGLGVKMLHANVSREEVQHLPVSPLAPSAFEESNYFMFYKSTAREDLPSTLQARRLSDLERSLHTCSADNVVLPTILSVPVETSLLGRESEMPRSRKSRKSFHRSSRSSDRPMSAKARAERKTTEGQARQKHQQLQQHQYALLALLDGLNQPPVQQQPGTGAGRTDPRLAGRTEYRPSY
jgi:hypothetical protein